jgi:hypothetical protein
VYCINVLILVALGNHQASGLICYSWRLPPPRRLGARDSIEHFKKIVKFHWKIGVRGLVLASPKKE